MQRARGGPIKNQRAGQENSGAVDRPLKPIAQLDCSKRVESGLDQGRVQIGPGFADDPSHELIDRFQRNITAGKLRGFRRHL